MDRTRRTHADSGIHADPMTPTQDARCRIQDKIQAITVISAILYPES